MTRIAQAFRDGLLDGINRRFGRTDCEAEGVLLTVRLLVALLQSSGAIDPDHLRVNAERWAETIKGRTEKNPYHNEGVLLVVHEHEVVGRFRPCDCLPVNLSFRLVGNPDFQISSQFRTMERRLS